MSARVVSRTWLVALLFAAVAVYFVSLGNAAIWDANEAYYVETPREMLEAHDLVNPSFNYEPRFNKPVLSYWMVAALYRTFGVSVAVQRFGIALGAMVIIACAYVLARSSLTPSGSNPDSIPGAGRQDAGLWAAAGLAASPRLVMFARRIFIDVWITAFLSLTLAFFALSERYPARRRRFLILMYVSIGLGVLTKGPVAIALPALSFALYLGLRGELRRIRELMIPAGVLIVAAIAVPWYAALYHQHGLTYIRSFLVAENIERFTSGVGVRQERGAWFYVPVVFSDSFPWSMLLPAAFASAWRSRDRLSVLLWCWIVAIVVFFSFSAGKQDLYVFPIVAAVAALGGLVIDRGLSDPRWARWVSMTMGIAGLLLAIAGGAVLGLFEAAGRVYALDAARIVGAVGLAGGLATLGLAVWRRPAPAALALLAAMTLADWVFVARVLPQFEQYKPVPFFGRTLAGRLVPGDSVVDYQVSLPSLTYYLRRHVDHYFDAPHFLDAMRSDARVYAVLSADDYAALAPGLAGRTCVVERRPTFDLKLNSVLAREPLPELLLITNRCGG